MAKKKRACLLKENTISVDKTDIGHAATAREGVQHTRVKVNSQVSYTRCKLAVNYNRATVPDHCQVFLSHFRLLLTFCTVTPSFCDFLYVNSIIIFVYFVFILLLF